MSKEMGSSIQTEAVGAAVAFDEAKFPQDKDRSTLVARQIGGFGPIKKYAYDVVTFIPRDPMEGGEDTWLIEKDVKLGIINRYPSKEQAEQDGARKLNQSRNRFERKAKAKAKKLEKKK
jgi:hypothetical protein